MISPRPGRATGNVMVVPAGPPGIRWPVCIAIVGVLAVAIAVVVCHALAETVLALSSRYPVPRELLVTARELEPGNPETNRLLAVYTMDVQNPPDFRESRALLDRAVALGPNRMQTWVDLGRNYELTGDIADAEQAYLRAGAIAPAFWKPQWALGNLYIRNGRLDDGIRALSIVADRNPNLVPLVIRTAWQATGGNVAAVTRSAGDTYVAQLELLRLLVERDMRPEALALWTRLADAHPIDDPLTSYGKRLASSAMTTGNSEQAIAIWIRLFPASMPATGTMANPGFEEPIPEQAQTPFAWTLNQNPDARISVDAGRTNGKSLRVDYKLKGNDNVVHASEFVRVVPGQAYTLRFWVKTRELTSVGLPSVAVVDAAGAVRVPVSKELPGGTNDWTQYSLPIVAPASGLVSVSVGRNSCGATCPIFGTIWIDDLELLAR